MDGRTLKAGAVAGVTRTRHPIDLARAVMEQARPHVMLARAGRRPLLRRAAASNRSTRAWFRTEERWQRLQALARAASEPALDPDAPVRHRRRRRARRRGRSRGRDLHRRHDRKALGPRRRFPDHRRGHLCARTASARSPRPAPASISSAKAPRGRSATASRGSGESLTGAAQGDDRWPSARSAATAASSRWAPDGRPAFAINDLGMYRGRMAAGRAPETAIYADETLKD
jgi:beta-aspartyl-peptidase (threonine type)